MSWVFNEPNGLINLLLFLMPGFVAAQFFYLISSYPKPGHFGQVIHALSFTVVGQGGGWLVDQTGIFGALNDDWLTGAAFIATLLFALLLAPILVLALNNNIFYNIAKSVPAMEEQSSARAHMSEMREELNLREDAVMDAIADKVKSSEG